MKREIDLFFQKHANMGVYRQEGLSAGWWRYDLVVKGAAEAEAIASPYLP